MNAHTSSASRMSSTQMMINGAMATMGVTCRITAYGNSDSSISRDCTNSTAISSPSTAAASSAAPVICRVMPSDTARLGQSAHSAWAICTGPGST